LKVLSFPLPCPFSSSFFMLFISFFLCSHQLVPSLPWCCVCSSIFQKISATLRYSSTYCNILRCLDEICVSYHLVSTWLLECQSIYTFWSSWWECNLVQEDLRLTFVLYWLLLTERIKQAVLAKIATGKICWGWRGAGLFGSSCSSSGNLYVHSVLCQIHCWRFMCEYNDHTWDLCISQCLFFLKEEVGHGAWCLKIENVVS
jgi:hypothetical protein